MRCLPKDWEYLKTIKNKSSCPPHAPMSLILGRKTPSLISRVKFEFVFLQDLRTPIMWLSVETGLCRDTY